MTSRNCLSHFSFPKVRAIDKDNVLYDEMHQKDHFLKYQSPTKKNVTDRMSYSIKRFLFYFVIGPHILTCLVTDDIISLQKLLMFQSKKENLYMQNTNHNLIHGHYVIIYNVEYEKLTLKKIFEII